MTDAPGDDRAAPSPKVKGPASYFPSIEKTYGRPMEDWFALVRSAPVTRHGEIVSWLKAEHGLGHGHATAIVAHVRALDAADGA
jgi:hypothetical protein